MKKFLFNVGLSITAGLIGFAFIDELTGDRPYAMFSGGVTTGAELIFCTLVDARNKRAENGEI